MELLLQILSWAILMVNCSWVNIGWYSKIYWYYTIWTYEVNYCISNDTDFDSVVYHELWHLFWYMYAKKKYNSEPFADAFSKCYMSVRCRPKLIKMITPFL